MAVRRVPRGLDRTPGDHGEKFPGFDVVAQLPTWDVVTAGVVLNRLGPPPPIRFFDRHEEAVARALLDQLLDQRDDPRVPVLAMIDARLAEEQTDGWRYHDLPHDAQAWRDSVHALDDDARHAFGAGFAVLTWTKQGLIIDRMHRRGGDDWHGMPAARVWNLWTRYAAMAFYSHPWAWNEIGFGGPAYPRGYKNLGLDRREPWEVADSHPGRDLVELARRVEEARRHDAAYPDPPVVGLSPNPLGDEPEW
ncbi:MAG TPA: gluconate 2-dehydrogenase subunit 3 family protein [Rugosimonospora sp.]